MRHSKINPKIKTAHESGNFCCAQVSTNIVVDVITEKNRASKPLANSGKGEFSNGVRESSDVLNVCEEYTPWWGGKSKAVMPRGTECWPSMGTPTKRTQLDTSFCLHPIHSSNAVIHGKQAVGIKH
jgi:hypothetical protein